MKYPYVAGTQAVDSARLGPFLMGLAGTAGTSVDQLRAVGKIPNRGRRLRLLVSDADATAQTQRALPREP